MRLRVKEIRDKNGKSTYIVQKRHWLFGWIKEDYFDYHPGSAEHDNIENATRYINSLSRSTKIVFEINIK